jgi:alanyl-tRNA synthetase
VVVLGSVRDGRPTIVAAITEDLISQGLNAVDLVKFVSAPLGGGGGGKPTLAQAGGKDATKITNALDEVEGWVKERLAG